MQKIEIPRDFECHKYDKCSDCPCQGFFIDERNVCKASILRTNRGKTIYIADKGEKLFGVDVLDTILNLIEGWINIEALRGENENHPLVKVKELVSRIKE